MKSLAVKEALGRVALRFTTSFRHWPGFQTLDFTNVLISAKEIQLKPFYTHVQAQTPQLHLLKQVSSGPGDQVVLCVTVLSRIPGILNMHGASTLGCGKSLSGILYYALLYMETLFWTTVRGSS